MNAIESMLKKEPEERISMFDLLHHPWLRRYQREANGGGWDTSDSSLYSDSIETLEDERGDKAASYSKQESGEYDFKDG